MKCVNKRYGIIYKMVENNAAVKAVLNNLVNNLVKEVEKNANVGLNASSAKTNNVKFNNIDKLITNNDRRKNKESAETAGLIKSSPVVRKSIKHYIIHIYLMGVYNGVYSDNNVKSNVSDETVKNCLTAIMRDPQKNLSQNKKTLHGDYKRELIKYYVDVITALGGKKITNGNNPT